MPPMARDSHGVIKSANIRVIERRLLHELEFGSTVHIVLVIHMSTCEAIADFVDRELEIVEGIQRGLEDMKADRVTPHKSAMRRLRATVARAAKGKP